MEDQLDVLRLPDFKPSGVVKLRSQTLKDGDWVRIFNLWVLSRQPVPSIIYQQRGPNVVWAPNMLDITVGGHYTTGESGLDGIREAEEELGKTYNPARAVYVGQKMHVGEVNERGQKKNIMEIYIIEDDSPLASYKLDPNEVYAICSCPIAELLKVHHDQTYAFQAKAMKHDGTMFDMTVTQKSFPWNWDNYHYKIARLAERYFQGDQDLLY
jgi:hypothetical protein